MTVSPAACVPMMILFYAHHPVLCSQLWTLGHLWPIMYTPSCAHHVDHLAHLVPDVPYTCCRQAVLTLDDLHQIATFTFKRWWRPLTKCGMSESIDQSVNYINLRYFHHLLLFPPLGTNARPEKPAKIHSSDTVLLGTKHFIIIWKESNGGASRQYLLHLHMTLLDGKLLMGETKYLIRANGEYFGGLLAIVYINKTLNDTRYLFGRKGIFCWYILLILSVSSSVFQVPTPLWLIMNIWLF